MPLYDYYCEACHKTTELLQKVTDPIAIECPHCHAHQLKKQVSAAAFQLKGSGWYVTDFRDNNKPPKEAPAKASTTDTTTKEAPATTTTETKKED